MTKFKSFSDLSTAVNKPNPERWAKFLKDKGHTEQSFNCMPEHLKTSLKFSFLKKK